MAKSRRRKQKKRKTKAQVHSGNEENEISEPRRRRMTPTWVLLVLALILAFVGTGIWHFHSQKDLLNTALEIINENQVPVFQFIYKTPSHIVFNGIFPYPGGLLFASEEGVLINPVLPATVRLKRIFKYPSWKYPSQYEEHPIIVQTTVSTR